MTSSVIIPTYNRPQELGDCLGSLLGQSRLPDEVIVVDNGSPLDGSWVRDQAEAFDKKSVAFRYLQHEGGNSLTAARNAGFRNSCGDLLVYLDDDVLLDGRYLEELLRVYEEHPDAVGVQGYIRQRSGLRTAVANLLGRAFCLGHVAPDQCHLLPSLGTIYPAPLTRVIPCDWLSGANHSYRRSVLERLQYDEGLRKYSEGEDIDLSHRVSQAYGGGLYITPHARLQHRVSPRGRMPSRELTVLCEVYDLYLFFKLMAGPPHHTLIYLWSRLGKLLFGLMHGAGSVFRLLDAYWYCLRHLAEIRNGELAFFNEGLS